MKISYINTGIIYVVCLLAACQSHMTEEREQEVVWQSKTYSIYADSVVQGPHVARVISDNEILSNYRSPGKKSQSTKANASEWKLSMDISSLPQYSSDYPLLNAMYNMSLEEMLKNIEEDGTFRTGKEWAGVWTRDISYSLILSMANLKPEVSKKSLMRKVKNDRIIQDSGTGGAYPVSTDRIVWAIAAWELYNATGEREWLEQSYNIIKNSMEDDLINAYNDKTGLFRGESSFLDWREQTYPEWMEPADIFESQNLGTNAVFYQASIILSKMAEMTGDTTAAEKYAALAATVKKGINDHLWIPEKGYYGQYLYGRNHLILSPRAEALGEALSVIFGVADSIRQETIVSSTPVTAFGIPSIYPQIPDIPPYHNNGIWPFVQAYWSLAAAKAGNEEALMHSLSAIYRPAAFFLTNKENFVASTGDYAGTQINSDRQLWSVAGNLGMVYKIFFGMDLQPDKLVFKPFVPAAFKGTHRLTNFNYRNAVLNIEVEGYGNAIESFVLDGERQESFQIPANIKGQHTIAIKLADNTITDKYVNILPDRISPATPKVYLVTDQLKWDEQENIEEYKVIRNGESMITTPETGITISPDEYAEFQVVAIDEQGYESFASEPVKVGITYAVLTYEMEDFEEKATHQSESFSGNGFLELTKDENPRVTMNIEVPKAGIYAVDFRYANGSGPINTDNRAAIRTLRKNNSFAGTIVFPQRGVEEWSNWGYTNSINVELQKGSNTLVLSFEPANENMHGEINRAMVDYVRLTLLEDKEQ